MPVILLPPIDFPRIVTNLELRERFEQRANPDFNRQTSDTRSNLYSRFRAGVRIDASPKWTLVGEYQYAHDLAQTPARNFSTYASDANLAYAETHQHGWTATVGRQKIVVGDQRLIGPLEWANVARSFDGVRIRNARLDAWIARIGLGPVEPKDLVLSGLTVKRVGPGEASLIFKHDKPGGRSTDLATLDYLAKQKLGSWSLEGEAALQFGRSAGVRHEAWALHGRATHPIAKGLKGYIEANAASGGSDADVVRTFDNLYPTNHFFYGLADLQGWRNMSELAIGLAYSPTKKLDARLDYHAMGLRDASDAWYGASGAPNRRPGGVFRDPQGLSGRDVGSEIDFELVYRATSRTTLSAGLGLFRPGGFVGNVNGSSDTQTWSYVQLQMKF